MAIQNDKEAQATVAELLNHPVNNPGPTWLKVVDLCFYARKRLVNGSTEPVVKPKPNRTAYWRQYKRDWRAKHKAP